MFNLPKEYFADIPADEMMEIMDGMESSEQAFRIAQCESRKHAEHWGELWQCAECLRVFCWAEDAGEIADELCNACAAYLRVRKTAVAFA
jgi:hypothetical protein